MAQLSRADVKRVILSFCLWERTPVSRGGGLAAPAGTADDGGEEEEERGGREGGRGNAEERI